jgi:glycosyltransferase involved in cell wall biosynthesis
MKDQVLFVTRHDPSKCSGGDYASRAFINAFSDIINNDLVVFLTDEADISIFRNRKNIKTIKVPPRTLYQKIKGIFLFEIHRFRQSFSNYIVKNYQSINYIVLDGSVVGDLVNIAKKYKIPVITLHHNVEAKYHKDAKSIETLFGVTSYIIRRNERIAFQKSHLNLTLSNYDKDELIKLYKINNSNYCYTLGGFEYDSNIYTSFYKPSKENKALTLVIAGTLADKQTFEGVFWFIRKLLPKINEKYSNNFTVIIAGRSPSKKLIKSCKENEMINLIANPINIDEYIQKADIYVCPTKLGSGLKLRIMDGLRNGLPVLTHEVSARGYDKHFDKPWFKIFNNVTSFINGLDEIIANLKEGKFKDSDIISTYYNEFSFEAGKKRLVKILLETKTFSD